MPQVYLCHRCFVWELSELRHVKLLEAWQHALGVVIKSLYPLSSLFPSPSYQQSTNDSFLALSCSFSSWVTGERVTCFSTCPSQSYLFSPLRCSSALQSLCPIPCSPGCGPANLAQCLLVIPPVGSMCAFCLLKGTLGFGEQRPFLFFFCPMENNFS